MTETRVVRSLVDRTLPLPERTGLVESTLAGYRTKHLDAQRLDGFQFGRPELCPDEQVPRAAQSAGFAQGIAMRFVWAIQIGHGQYHSPTGASLQSPFPGKVVVRYIYSILRQLFYG